MDKNIEKKIKVIVAHPARQHSFKTAAALKKNGMLLKYITTVYNKENSFLIKIVSKFVGKDNANRAKNRRCEELSDTDVIQYCEILGLIEIFVYRFLKRFYFRWHDFVSDRFGIKVAKYAIKHNADAVIMYDTTAGSCFEYLEKKAPNIARIMDATHINRNYQARLFADIKEEKWKNESESLINIEEDLNRIRKENIYTQYFLTASSFLKKTLVLDGINEENIFTVPYGSYFKGCGNIRDHKKVEFVFVGQVTYAKGVTVLIETFKRLPKDSANLKIIGNYYAEPKIYSYYKDTENVEFLGLLLHGKVEEELKKSSVFVLPSFMEGMSLAGLEALGCGLPLLCSLNSGVNDAVKNGKNGFVFPAGDTDSLYKYMLWFIENRDEIPKMSENAKETAKKYTWDNYEKNLVATIKEILNK